MSKEQKNEGKQQYDNIDIIAGFVNRGQKQDGSAAAFFQVVCFALDVDGLPIKDGTWKDNDGNTHARHKVARVYRIAESSLMKMAAGETRRCRLYLRDKSLK